MEDLSSNWIFDALEHVSFLFYEIYRLAVSSHRSNSFSTRPSCSLSLHALAISISRLLKAPSALPSSDPRGASVLAIRFLVAQGSEDPSEAASCLADFSSLRRSCSAILTAFFSALLSSTVFNFLYAPKSSGRGIQRL